MANPLFKERVGEAGLEFIPLGSEEELNRVGQSLTSLPKSRIWEVALRWTAESAAQAVDYLEQRRTRYPTENSWENSWGHTTFWLVPEFGFA